MVEEAPTTDPPSACATINYSEENATVTCQLTKPGESTMVNSVDLNEIIDQLAQFQVTKNTVVWFQLWGANGGEGSNSDGGQAGKIGYSQMITSVADFESRGEEGSVIYFYLGQHGTHNTKFRGPGWRFQLCHHRGHVAKSGQRSRHRTNPDDCRWRWRRWR